MEMIEKDKITVKKIDIEGLVYKSNTVLSWIGLLILLLNRYVFHIEWLPFMICGYCIALFIIAIIVGIAGNINYKSQMDYYKWLSKHLDEIEEIANGNEKV